MLALLRTILFLLLLATTVFGQIRSSTIVGRVAHSSRAAVPKAELIVRDVNTNQTYPLATSGTGEFTQPYLPFGAYEVIVKKQGFKSSTTRGFNLATAQPVRADVTLAIGTVESAVVVEASGSRTANGIRPRRQRR